MVRVLSILILSKLLSAEFNNWVRRLQEVLAKQNEVNEALNKALGITEAENTKMKTFAELARQIWYG